MITATIPAVGRIISRSVDAPGVFTIAIQSQSVQSFRPGQFNMIGVRGIGEAPISCSAIEKDSIYHTIRVVGNVTAALASMPQNAQVTLRGPYGTPWPIDDRCGDLLFVAGGIGIAALRAAIDEVVCHRDRFRNIYVLYGAHRPSDLIYGHEFEIWSESSLTILKTVDIVPENDQWRGSIGLVSVLLDDIPIDLKQTTTFICGPERMMGFVATELIRRGQDSTSIYISMERRMRCGLGKCGHCMIGPYYVCKDGPVFAFDQIREWQDIAL